MTRDFLDIESDRWEWSYATFTEATPISSLRKAEAEIKEIEADIEQGVRNPEEYADVIMCLFDSAARQGISALEVLTAYENKVKVNRSRKWTKNQDNSYSHVKGNRSVQEDRREWGTN